MRKQGYGESKKLKGPQLAHFLPHPRKRKVPIKGSQPPLETGQGGRRAGLQDTLPAMCGTQFQLDTRRRIIFVRETWGKGGSVIWEEQGTKDGAESAGYSLELRQA